MLTKVGEGMWNLYIKKRSSFLCIHLIHDNFWHQINTIEGGIPCSNCVWFFQKSKEVNLLQLLTAVELLPHFPRELLVPQACEDGDVGTLVGGSPILKAKFQTHKCPKSQRGFDYKT